MRWHIIRTLLHKEVLRHLANKGGLVLLTLLAGMTMLLSFFGKEDSPATGVVGNVQLCYIDYWDGGGWIDHLRDNVPGEWLDRVRFRHISKIPTDGEGRIIYRQNTGAIQIRPAGTGRYKVWSWYPGGGSGALAPYEVWFWRETGRFFQQEALSALRRASPNGPTPAIVPEFETERSSMLWSVETASTLAAIPILAAIFLVCVYLLSSLTCEERERGVLLAQALSPASPLEILGAKFLFYPVFAMAAAAVLAGIYEPATLARPFFWLALIVTALGAMAVGQTIATLARTQRAASMGALCYLLVVSLVLLICKEHRIPYLSWLALEFHAPRMFEGVLRGQVTREHWGNLWGATALAAVWCTLATVLFRRRGWQ